MIQLSTKRDFISDVHVRRCTDVMIVQLRYLLNLVVVNRYHGWYNRFVPVFGSGVFLPNKRINCIYIEVKDKSIKRFIVICGKIRFVFLINLKKDLSNPLKIKESYFRFLTKKFGMQPLYPEKNHIILDIRLTFSIEIL